MSSGPSKCLLNIVKSFSGHYEDELSIEQGQIAQFIQKIDKFWYEVFLEDKTGKIPIDCCREIKNDMLDNLRIVPEMKQLVFISKHDFINNCEEGDLRFSRFEIIIGFYQINNDWWNGTRLSLVRRESNNLTVNDSDCGIFPLTFVWKLRNDLLPDFVFDSKGIKLKSPDITYQDVITPKTKPESKLKQIIENKEIPLKKTYLFYVKVIKTMDAKLDEEIDLPELEEILGVISIYDKLYYQGESLSRKIIGIFPKNFVSKIEPEELPDQIKLIINDQSETTGCDNQDFDDSSVGKSSIQPSFSPPPPPPSFDILSYESEKLYSKITPFETEIDQTKNISTNGDLPPSYETAIISQSQPVAYGYANYMFNEMEPYGRALYDFEAQDDSELSLRQNQIVRLIRYYDQDWMEGEINGRIGFFPRSYISIIVDCNKYSKGFDSSIQIEAPTAVNQNQVNAIDFPPNSYAKVLYDFDGEMEQDLKIRAGDVITMLRSFTSTDWIEAQDSSGNVGFVHLNLCQPFKTSSSDSNESPNIEKRNSTNVQETSIYPEISDYLSEKQIKDSSQPLATTSNHGHINLKPHRRAPVAPRRNIFPTFNQFLINEKQEHYQFDLDGNESASQTVQNLDSLKGKNQKEKQRQCVISELIQTEKDYCHALSICYQVFDSSSYEAEKCNVNVEKLLSNMKNIINLSKNLIKLLENYAHNRTFIDQRVGICFLDLKFGINEGYTQYCRSHDSVHSLLKFYEGNSMSKDYMKNCLARIQDQTNCFDLSSIWIKPVQRILKYPLLLSELIKFTEEDHVDYEPLKRAVQMITDIATCINEHKRRQDLIQKYCKSKDTTLTEKLKNLSMHTVKKKSSRLRYRIISSLTFSSGTKDKDYEEALHTFQEIDKIIRTFIKDLKEYLNSLDKFHIELMVMIEAISEYCDLKRNPRFDIEKIRENYRQMYQIYFKKFRESIDRNVLKTLNLLLDKFNGPLRLISKREDKRIDYEASLKSKNDINLTKSTFEAMNQQLIDELPLLSKTSLQILFNCIEAFLCENKKLIGFMAKFQLDLHEIPLVKNTTFEFYQDIEDTFRVKYNLNFEQMLREFSLLHASSFQESSSTSAFTRFSRNRNSNTWKNSLPINKLYQPDSQQSQQNLINKEKQVQQVSHRKILMSKYSTQHLYMVVNNFEPCDIMEIPVTQGDLVGVIKYKEPTGSENRWYVDLGFIQGFIPRNLLVPYKVPTTIDNTLHEDPGYRYDQVPDEIHRYDTVPDEIHRYDTVPDSIDAQRYYSVPDEIIEHGSDHSSLLSFDEIDTSSNKVELFEFDPLAPRTLLQQSSENKSKSTTNSLEDNYYTAAYPFKASGPNQLSLDFGQRVLVLAKHDTSGNQEWWFVSRSNQKGYVPANYLKK